MNQRDQWQALKPGLDQPLSWSIPLGKVGGTGGILLRLHVVFAAFVAVRLAQAAVGPSVSQGSTLDPALAAMWLGALGLMIVLHELGHAIACRATGGSAEFALLWPLGGLTPMNPPHRWQAHLLTALGGPAVNVVFLLAMGPMLWVATGSVWNVVIFNPLDPFAGGVFVGHSWPLRVLYLLNHANLVLLAFNLLPVLPLDGGRVLQSALWARLGYSRATHVTVHVGLAGALAMAVAGVVLADGWLLSAGVVCGLMCARAFTELRWSDAHDAQRLPFMPLAGAHDVESSGKTAAPSRERGDVAPAPPANLSEHVADNPDARAPVGAPTRDESAMVDAILDKIAASGMASLSQSEQAMLHRATERQRQQRVEHHAQDANRP